MELANGKKNKFFTLQTEGENRYYIEDFNAEKTKGLNNIYLLTKEVAEESVVLDVGCAQGRFGKTLKEKNCTVYGIDIDVKAVEYAKKSGNYDEIFIMDITDKNTDEYKIFINKVNKIDVIILSDVLEHIENPTELIIEYSKLLKENGIILISVPNVAHIDIILNLMNDKFNYQDAGILDNTHLKFFTKSSVAEWINQINNTFDNMNFDCEYLGATFYNNNFLEYIKKNYYELFCILENSPNYNGLQVLFKLTKLSTTDETNHLNNLLNEEKQNVIKLLGDALKGKIKEKQNHKLVEGERLWFEMILEDKNKSLEWYENRVKELEKAIEWHHENDKNNQINLEQKDDSLEWYRSKVEDLEKAVEWHHENDKNNQNNQTRLEEKNKELKYKYDKDILNLRQIIFDMENSKSWKLTKFLRREKNRSINL